MASGPLHIPCPLPGALLQEINEYSPIKVSSGSLLPGIMKSNNVKWDPNLRYLIGVSLNSPERRGNGSGEQDRALVLPPSRHFRHVP